MTTASKMTGKYYERVGRRKTAVARVRLFADQKGHFLVNGLALEKYFPTEIMRRQPQNIMAKSPAAAKMSVSVKVSGGGLAGQATAVALGIARALILVAPEAKTLLRQGGHL